jgi:hypothetical protein
MVQHSDIDHSAVTGAGIPPSAFGAKGRILVGTGAGTYDDLPVGTDGHRLVANSGEAMGVEWVAAGGATITVEEDGETPVTDVDHIVFDGATVTDDTGGQVTVTITGGPGGSGVTYNATDIVPGSPDADDDEFDATDTSDPITGWTTLGTLNALDTNSTLAGHLYMRKNATSSTRVDGIYKTRTVPFTITAKLSDLSTPDQYMRAGIFIAAALPGDVETLAVIRTEPTGWRVDPWQLEVLDFTNPTSFNATVADEILRGTVVPIYLRIIVASSTDVTYQYSYGGQWFYTVVANRNPGFTVGAAGLFLNPQNASNDMHAWFDWIRFT